MSLAADEDDEGAIVKAASSLASAASHICEVAEAAPERAKVAEREGVLQHCFGLGKTMV